MLGDLLGTGIFPGITHQYRLITEQMIWRGKVPCLQCQRHLTDMWILYPFSLTHYEQLSCSEQFHPESLPAAGFTGRIHWRGGAFHIRYVRGVRWVYG